MYRAAIFRIFLALQGCRFALGEIRRCGIAREDWEGIEEVPCGAAPAFE